MLHYLDQNQGPIESGMLDFNEEYHFNRFYFIVKVYSLVNIMKDDETVVTVVRTVDVVVVLVLVVVFIDVILLVIDIVVAVVIVGTSVVLSSVTVKEVTVLDADVT